MNDSKKSLKRKNDDFSSTSYQLAVLEGRAENTKVFKPFDDQLRQNDLFPLTATGVEIFQINLGKMCNQVCKHCHVDAGPDRKEIMTKEVMEDCLRAIDRSSVHTVDLTGGAPEMNPNFRWLVEELSSRNIHVIVRCNLTIIMANKRYSDLPEFYKKHKIEVVSSLPSFSEKRTDSQRGDGVFGQSIKALTLLNEIGYGIEGSDLKLNLVYNPTGAFLPDSQESLEKEFKRALKRKFDIEFNQLYAITNIPISRYLEYLVRSDNYNEYMEKLVNAFNPDAARGVMCRNTVSISWEGDIYDCDFNQMLDLKVKSESQHIRNWNVEQLQDRDIITYNHCYGCTAGAGSSCGGTTA